MRHELLVAQDAPSLAHEAARVLSHELRRDEGRRAVAVSGGTTPWATFTELAACDLEWGTIDIYQVDERVVAADDAARNLAALEHSLGATGAAIHGMPVDDPDLAAAARRYGASLPPRFSFVHLGLGADGHTASLVPGDPVLDADDPVALTRTYAGHRRMTLTYAAIARASAVVWIVEGADKHHALELLLAESASIPAGRVEAPRSIVCCDLAAYGGGGARS